MNSELPTAEADPLPASPSSGYSEARPSRSRGTVIWLLLLLAFAGGIAATLWATPALKDWWKSRAGLETADNAAGLASLEDETASAASSSGAMSPHTVAVLEARLAAVSAQLDAISEQAASAGGNAARAEGLLIAFATRRVLDRGGQLGYLEGELRVRFGDAQPRAVATIINAANSPVTLADLQTGLDAVTPMLLDTSSETDWWTATKRELSNLIIIRRADIPSPVPQKAVERARFMLSAGRVDSALKEIERLPSHAKADNWIQRARQYNEARRALDVIEAAAILEPRSIASSPHGGGPTNMQVAPPPPAVQTVTPAPAAN